MAFALSRNARLFVTSQASLITSSGTMDLLTDLNTWRIPVLDGYSFSQGTTTQDIVISEAGATPARGSQTFNTALEPVNWSFGNYLRPRYDAIEGEVDAIERLMWDALSTGPTSDIDSDGGTGGAVRTADSMNVDFLQSNSNTLSQIGLLFDLNGVWYFISEANVDQVEIDFSIESIASATWTGFGIALTDVTSYANGGAWASPTGSLLAQTGVHTGAAGTYIDIPTGNLGCIRNKLTTVSLTDNAGLFQTAEVTNLAITGGSLTISNNITFLTPEALGVVNQPCGHFTGARTISGNITVYLKTNAGESGALLGYLATNVNQAEPWDFNFDLYIGGLDTDTTSPFDNAIVHVNMPHTHLTIPTLSTEEVLSLDMGFNALPYNESDAAFDLNQTNEIAIKYYADKS